MRAYCDQLGIPHQDQIIRKQASRGFADQGLVLTQQSLIPELTVTADGVFWHPVGADDADMLISKEIFPLGTAIERARKLLAEQSARRQAMAEAFVCA